MNQEIKILLILAAKAANYTIESEGVECFYISTSSCRNKSWNPLIDDGDAFRLAITCRITASQSTSDEQTDEPYAWATYKDIEFDEGLENGDLFTATRMAIIKVAAEIGKSMQ